MFRILFFILIVTFLFYSTHELQQTLQKQSHEVISQKFDEYIYAAISRNTLPEKKYNVVFFRENFIEWTPISSWKNTAISLNPLNTPLYQLHTWKKDISFQNTRSQDITTRTFSSNNCKGLFFDPCLRIWNLYPWNGDMYLGSTRIYEYPSEI